MGERALWLAVLCRTIRDATELAQEGQRRGRETVIKRVRRLLRDIHSPWFETICEFADYEPRKVRRKIIEELSIILREWR